MNQFFIWLRELLGSWRFWLVVPPWEIAVRVRLGKNATPLMPGLHFRVPFIDDITHVNTRLRITATPSITISNGDRLRPRTLAASVGYMITDPLAALMHYDDPALVVAAMVQAEAASLKSAPECHDAVRKYFAPNGISVEFVRYTEDVEVRTYRLMNSEASYALTSYGDFKRGTVRHGIPD